MVGLTLAIFAVFWAAIWFAHRDPDPLLYERIVPVTIVPTPPADVPDQVTPPAATKRAGSGAARRGGTLESP